MTEEQKREILHEINRVYDAQKQADAYKEKWDSFYREITPNMKFIVAYARNVGDELLYNERQKQIEKFIAITSTLYCIGYRVVYDDTEKAIDIVKM